MRQTFLIPLLLLVLLGSLPSLAVARLVHDFDCANCHKPSASLDKVTTIVCLDCHTQPNIGTTFPLYRTGPGNTNSISNNVFASGDASDAMGSVTAQGATPGDQTSHNWAAELDNDAAGATAPSHYFFYQRQNYSGGKVTCSRCHDPHGYLTDDRGAGSANPKLLKLGPGTEIDMCNDCHVSWASDTAPSEGGGTPTNVHPMVDNYAAIALAKPTQYNDVTTLNASAGEVTLNATGGIDCLSCHGVHWTDSDSSTTDGAGQALNPGDGKVLKANGPDFDQAAVAGVSLCQSCHKYQDHGSGRTQPIGCLVCHSAHLEDVGAMNNYMLRKSVTTYLPNGGATGNVNGLTLNSGDALNTRLWNYCFNCHDSAAAAIGHDSSWNCSDCHSHGDVDGSWTAAGACNTCHGYPPVQAIASDRDGGNAGYAVQSDATNYLDDSGHYKDESLTLHQEHAGGGTDYSFKCTACHAGNGHIDKSYDDVFISSADQLYNGNGLLTGGSAPTYSSAGSGTCSNVYCHSNGGPRGNTPTVNNPDAWLSGTAITTCDACHGNDVTDMVTRNNSATHVAHLNKGYSCQVCHGDTATDSTNLKLNAGAPPTVHVDGTADVAFDATSIGFALGSTSYGTDGTCSVYCHSNGTTNAAPDWDVAGSGACGSCHQYSNAGVATGSGTALGGSHAVHVYDADGPKLACAICHTHNGATGSANTDHVNGSIDKVTNYMDNVCNPCHGATNGGTGDDAEPVWGTAASVTCETCHSGSVIADITGGVTTPVKSDYTASGHGKSGVDQACSICHNSSDATNHLGALGDTDRLFALGGGYDSADAKAFCAACHADEDNHYANSNSAGSTDTSTDGDNCVLCHDPHGDLDKNSDALDAMLRATIGGRAVTGFTDKSDRATYYNTVDVGEGVCQTCHDPNEVSNFNRTTANTDHGGAGICVSCHSHNSSPAFKASCNSCHGDETSEQFWPYGSGGSIPTANDEVGEHDKHVLAIGQQLGYGDYTTTMYTDAQQKEICEYCHAGTSNDSDHGVVDSLDADVFVDSDSTRHAKSLWGGSDTNAAYDSVADTCSNVDCHNSKLTVDNSYGWYDNANNPGCILCHNDMTNTGIATGQTHNAHTTAAALYGISINCATCHDATTSWAARTMPANNHINGTFNMGGTASMTYTGSLPTGSGFGSCGTNNCHEDGRGNAPPAYTWGTAGSSACGICHAASPATNDHAVHLTGTNGPNIGTDCSGCHVANGNNSSMASMSTHINGTVTLKNVAVPATPYEVTSGQIGAAGNDAVDSCNLCHGGSTAANLAKDYWTTATKVTCESCHGDYDLAVIDGTTAPSRAGDNYDNWGHGRKNQGCSGCHSTNSEHISGSSDGANRLKLIIFGGNYEVLDERNTFCNPCHLTSGSMTGHFGDSNTVGGGSTDGLYCVTCHDPHGQSGYDAMVKASVGGTGVNEGTQTVTGFTDRDVRADYSNDSFTGICQTCHTAEVDFFNQSTNELGTHNTGANCLTCHPHSTSPAFKASCNACHGDETTGQFWPDGDTDTQIVAANNDSGRHDEHVLAIGQQLGYGDYSGTMYTDDQQKTICRYCHAVSDDDHGFEANLPAEVFKATVATVADTVVAKAIWDGSADADATYTKAGGSCATVDCHNSKTTTATGPNDYTWDGSDPSNCVMCHADVPSDTTSHSIHTASGTWNMACAECHAGSPAWGDTADTGTQTAPSSGHINGTFAIGGGNRTFTYSSGSCGVNECHNDGANTAADVAAYDWDTGATVGACVACHGAVVATNNHPAHSYAHNDTGGTGGTAQFVSVAIDCDDCHTNKGYQAGTASDHFDGAISFKATITYSGDTDITVANDVGSCSTLNCHSDGAGTKIATPLWDRAAATSDDCSICHLDRGASMSNSHFAHTGSNGVTTYLTSNGNQTTSSEYRFDCGVCHGNTIANHLDGDPDVLAGVNWTGGTNTCSTNACHQDGQSGAPVENPNWVTGFTAGDQCGKCHGNSPNSGAHSAHAVGIHYNNVYSGTGSLVTDDDARQNSHGDVGTSTIIGCNNCHWDTITVWNNDQNSLCSSCHDGALTDATPANGVSPNGDISINDLSKHVNGSRDVTFITIDSNFKSNAQLRDDISAVDELNSYWIRTNNYKQADGSSYDLAQGVPDAYEANGAQTCSNIACHNGHDVTWVAPAGDCSKCHTVLP